MKALFNKIERGQYQMSRHISEGAKALIERMLCVDPNKRITLEQIIQHPWFQVGFDKTELQIGATTVLSGGGSSLEIKLPDEEAVKNAVTNVEGAGAVLSPPQSALSNFGVHQQQRPQLKLGDASSPGHSSLSSSTASSPSSSPHRHPFGGSGSSGGGGGGTGLGGATIGGGEVPSKLSLLSDVGLDAFHLSSLLIASALTQSPFVDLASSSSNNAAAASAAQGSPARKASVPGTAGMPTTSHLPVYGGIRHFLVAGNPLQAYTAASDWLKTILPSALRSGGTSSGGGAGGGAGGGGAASLLQELRGFLTTPRGIMTFVMEVHGTADKTMSVIVSRKGMGDVNDFLESMKGLSKRLSDHKILLSEARGATATATAASSSTAPAPLNSAALGLGEASVSSSSSSPSPSAPGSPNQSINSNSGVKRLSPEQQQQQQKALSPSATASSALPAITSQRKVLGASPK